MVDLRHKTATGILWSFAEQFGRRGIGVVTTLMLAKFLAPEDFGLVAIMAVFLAISSSLMDSGFKDAIIRMQSVDQVDLDTAFYSNLGLATIAYSLLFFFAPFIANFYSEPNLIALIRVASISVLINAFNVVQIGMLSRALNFKTQIQSTLPAGLIGGLAAVGMAYTNFGIWALIAQLIISSFVMTLILWSKTEWRPSLNFSYPSFRKMYSFGNRLFLADILGILFSNMYIIGIAKLFNATTVGCYFLATKIQDLLFNQLVNSIQNVTYPALTSIQNDSIRLKAAYRKILIITTFLSFPAMLFTAVFTKPFFTILLPEQWEPAILYVQLTCLAGLLLPLHSLNLNILKVKGRSDLFFYIEVIKRLVSLVIFMISYRHGMVGILVGQITSSVIAYLPNAYFSKTLINYTLKEQLGDFVPNLLLSFAIGLIAYLVILIGALSKWVEILVFPIILIALYIIGAKILNLAAYQQVEKYLHNKWLNKFYRK